MGVMWGREGQVVAAAGEFKVEWWGRLATAFPLPPTLQTILIEAMSCQLHGHIYARMPCTLKRHQTPRSVHCHVQGIIPLGCPMPLPGPAPFEQSYATHETSIHPSIHPSIDQSINQELTLTSPSACLFFPAPNLS